MQEAAAPRWIAEESELLDLELPDQVRSCGLKIWRARQHFDVLHEHFVAYEKSRPGRIVERENQPDGQPPSYVVEVDPLPDIVPLVIGDLLSCCRVALDHIAWGLVPKTNREASQNPSWMPFREQTSIKFPFLFKDPDEGGSVELNRSTANGVWISDERAVTMLTVLQPYRGTEPLHSHPRVWLELLVQRDKHRVVTPVAVVADAFSVLSQTSHSAGSVELENGDAFELPGSGPILQPYHQIDLGVDIRFEEIADYRVRRMTRSNVTGIVGKVPRESTAEIILAKVINLVEGQFLIARAHQELFTDADAAAPVHFPFTNQQNVPPGFPPKLPKPKP